MKSFIVAICLISSVTSPFVFVQSVNAQKEFETLRREKARRAYDRAIFKAIRAEGCDTEVLDAKFVRDEIGMHYVFVSTRECSCQAWAIGFEGAEEYMGSAECLRK